MALSEGTKIGSYEVVGLIGQGGMGEVYQARDTKLDRDVADALIRDSAQGVGPEPVVGVMMLRLSAMSPPSRGNSCGGGWPGRVGWSRAGDECSGLR